MPPPRGRPAEALRAKLLLEEEADPRILVRMEPAATRSRLCQRPSLLEAVDVDGAQQPFATARCDLRLQGRPQERFDPIDTPSRDFSFLCQAYDIPIQFELKIRSTIVV